MLMLLFVLSAAALAYTYAGYPWLLDFWRRRQPRREPQPVAAGASRLAPLPRVSVIIAAHNEAKAIRGRLQNLVAQHYPADRLEIIVGSDGSTDATVSNARAFGDSRLRVLDLPRHGRALVHNACATVATGEILVFTDAGTQFDADCLRRLLAPFAEPAVGCTGGHLVYTNSDQAGVARSAGWYWRYELLLRRLESALGSTVAVTGACMALRKVLFRPLADVDDIDDAAPVDALLQGYQVRYVAGALAYDRLPASSAGELAARQRIVTKNLTAIIRRPAILSPLRHPRAALMLLSHRVLRYLTPVFLLLLFLTNSVLLEHRILQITWAVQALFYATAALGFAADRLQWRIPVLSACFALCLANLGFLLGVFNVARGRGVAHYEPIR